jgi:phage terminase large subunit-like protein
MVVMDPAGNRKFEKARSSGRIDGMVALAMAINAAASRPRAAFNVRALIG